MSLLEEGASSEDLAIASANVSQAKFAYELIKSTARSIRCESKRAELAEPSLNKQNCFGSSYDQLDKTTIKSPIDGVISVKYLNTGEMATLGNLL